MNDGNAVFTKTNQSLGDAFSHDVLIGDLDGDGDLDAFVVNHLDPSMAWLNDGNGFFTQANEGIAPWGNARPRYGALGDIDAMVI